MREGKKDKNTNKALTIIGWVMCIVLVPILIINCTLLVKGFIKKDEVPSFIGAVPLIVLSDSMYPDIKSGDLIICNTIDPEEIKVDDVISFYDPASKSSAVVTHKVIEIIEEDDGGRSFRTKGINNNSEDRLAVPDEDVVGKYNGFRIPALGNIAIFMQSTAGLIVCVVLPIVLFVAYDVLRRKAYEKHKDDDMTQLLAELEALRAANAEKKEGAENEIATPQNDNTDVPET
jgi:signal peptidase